MHRPADRHHQAIDAGDALLGIEEQPLPIERDDLHLQRLRAGYRRIRIEPVRADPDHAPEEDHHQDRDRPDDQLDPPGKGPVGPVGGARVAGTKPPGEGQRGEDRGYDDRQHDRQRVEHDLPIARPDRTRRIHHPAAAGQRDQERECRQAARPDTHWHRYALPGQAPGTTTKGSYCSVSPVPALPKRRKSTSRSARARMSAASSRACLVATSNGTTWAMPLTSASSSSRPTSSQSTV